MEKARGSGNANWQLRGVRGDVKRSTGRMVTSVAAASYRARQILDYQGHKV